MTFLYSRETHPENSHIRAADVTIGNDEVIVIAGPCAIESEEQMLSAAQAAKKYGAKILRGGAYKPRSNPHDFQGLGEEGLKILKKVSKEVQLPTVTEILDIRDLELLEEHADIIQVGTRNMYNVALLKELGKSKKPILLKRGRAATIEDFLLAAEHILLHGNPNVILCERGIRTFETDTKNTFSLAAIPLLKELSHLPVIGDPSHATGKRSLIKSMTNATIAAGADAVMIDIHPEPKKALCDASQAITPEEFGDIMITARKVAEAIGRHIA